MVIVQFGTISSELHSPAQLEQRIPAMFHHGANRLGLPYFLRLAAAGVQRKVTAEIQVSCPANSTGGDPRAPVTP
jgi:hypothetical protein